LQVVREVVRAVQFERTAAEIAATADDDSGRFVEVDMNCKIKHVASSRQLFPMGMFRRFVMKNRVRTCCKTVHANPAGFLV